jgi:hypothetical protein
MLENHFGLVDFKSEKVGSVRNIIFENGNRSNFSAFILRFTLTRAHHD